jgi:hypothetical protein
LPTSKGSIRYFEIQRLILAGENKFEIIYCDGGSKYSENYLNQRCSINENIYPISEFAPQDYVKRVNNLISGHTNNHDHNTSQQQVNQDESKDKDPKDENADPEKIKLEILENFYRELNNCIENKLSQTSTSYISKQLGRALSYLKNWEILSDKSVKLACRILKSVAGSGMNYMLAQQSNVVLLSDLLSSHDVNSKIKYIVVN